MARNDSALDRLGDRAEGAILGGDRRLYWLFVRAVVVVLVVVLLADLLWVAAGFLDVGSLPSDIETALRALTAAAITLFVLTGLVQVLVLGRVFQRGTEEVTEAADELERTAADVTEAADDLEQTADEVAEAAETTEELSEGVTKQPPGDRREEAAIEAEASEVQDRTREAKETAGEVKERARDRQEAAKVQREKVEQQREIDPEADRGTDRVDEDDRIDGDDRTGTDGGANESDGEDG